MKLYILYQNVNAARQDMIHAGLQTTPTKRLASVNLTEDQIRELSPKKVGVDSGDPVFEEIHTVWVERFAV